MKMQNKYHNQQIYRVELETVYVSIDHKCLKS